MLFPSVVTDLEGFHHFLGQVGQFVDVFVTALDGTKLKLFLVLGDVRIGGRGCYLILYFVLKPSSTKP